MGIEPKARDFEDGQKGDCMNSILLSTQECGSQELLQLTEMLCREQDFQIIVSRAFPFMEKERKTKTVENRAGDLLTKLGFKANLKGVVYLKAAARIGLEDREELEGVTKRLYPAIAKECRTCAGRVEHAIRHAIHTSWEREMSDSSAWCLDTTGKVETVRQTRSLSHA
mgnify:CR=1 FL=1